MDQSKKWYQSKTIIGGIVAMIMMIVAFSGFDLDEGVITEFVTNLFGLITMGVAIYGRIVAKHKIK